MLHLIFKNLRDLPFATFFILVLAILASFATPHNVYAIDPDYTKACAELETQTWDSPPSPMAIICPIARLLNVFIFASAAIFVMLILVSSVKYGMAQGDPKAMQGAKQTLTTAVIGFIVIIGAFTILAILRGVLGLKNNLLLDPFGALSQGLARFLEELQISIP